MFLREVFSDYFEPTNVLYIDTGCHNSGNFINKYMQTHVPLSEKLSPHSDVPILKLLPIIPIIITYADVCTDRYLHRYSQYTQ